MAMNFPDAPVVGQQFASPDGDIYVWDGVKWTIPAGAGGGGVTPITQSMTFYVAPNGTDTPGNGVTPSTPFRTANYAWSIIQGNYRFALLPPVSTVAATIQLAPGTYPDPVSFAGNVPGQNGQYNMILRGDPNNPSGTILAGGLSADHQAMCYVQGFSLPMLYANTAAFIVAESLIFTNNTFPAGPQACHVTAQACGIIVLHSNYTIAGSAAIAHWFVQGGGSQIWIFSGAYAAMTSPGPVITIQGNPTFGDFARVGVLGTIWIEASVTYVNGANVNAPQYGVGNNGVISTGTGGTMVLPGNQPGTLLQGGVFF